MMPYTHSPTTFSEHFTKVFYSFRLLERNVPVALSSPTSLWTISKIQVREDYLFHHVKHFLNANAGAKVSRVSTGNAVIFELKPGLQKTSAGISLEKLFTQPLRLQTNQDTYDFKFHHGTKQSIYSPKLILLPEGGIGVLTLTLALENGTVESLVDFNYACRSITRKFKRSSKIIPRSDQPTQRNREIFSALSPHNTGPSATTFADLIDFLIQDCSECYIPISPKHLHLFTYAKLANHTHPENLNNYLFNLSRVYNQNYRPPFSTPQENREVIQTFRDIYFGASQEGGCILLNAGLEEHETPFFQNFSDNVLKTRYSWIYLITYLQRLLLINTSYVISDLIRSDKKATNKEVSSTIEFLSSVQLRMLFSEVSHLSMHNEFYDLCRKQFRIPQLFAELKEEILDLNAIIQQQVARDQLEAKERAVLAQEKQQRFESRINLILFCLGLLTFISVWKDFTDIIDGGLSAGEWKALVNLGGLILIVGGVVYGITARRNN